MQRLVLDIGNTHTKIAIFGDGTMIYKGVFSSLETAEIDKILANFSQLTSAIVSSVRKDVDEIEAHIRAKMDLLEFHHNTPVPIKNAYKTPETLGKDRIALAVGASKHAQEKPALVISMGTCITYDFVNKDAVYQGGAIAPGVQMRFDALHNFTHKLPHIPFENWRNFLTDFSEKQSLSENTWTGTDTETSILSGVLQGVFSEIHEKIRLYKNQHPDVQIFLTGGDGKYFENQLIFPIFALPNLGLEGLNEILRFNGK